MKISRLSRVVKLLTTLQAGKSSSVEQLTENLGVSRRTLFRDLQQLQAIGVPYKYDNKTKNYYVEPDFFLPPIDLNLKEALSLLMLIHKARNHIPMPFKNSALLAGLKIENNLPADIKNFCHSNLKNIQIKPMPHSPMESLDNIFSNIQKAITKKFALDILYHSLYENSDIQTTLQPYHLMYNRRAWYVIGRSSMHKSTRTFKLNRIKKLETTNQYFATDKDFDSEEYLGRAWSMIPEGSLYTIKLRFLPKVAKNVTEVKWHSTQKSDFNEDGSADVEFRVNGINEIYWWILGYGDQVKVLAPAILRKKITTAAQNMIKLNNSN